MISKAMLILGVVVFALLLAGTDLPATTAAVFAAIMAGVPWMICSLFSGEDVP